MKHLTLAAALVAVASTAYAADLPSRRAPPVFVPPPIPVFSWTGFYIGGHVGYAWGRDTDVATVSFAGASASAPYALVAPRPNGLIGGAHIGYNFSTQGLGGLGAGLFGGGLVFGVEGDLDGTDYRSAPNTLIAAAPLVTFAQGQRVQIEGSARGRLGIAVDRTLFYATGGAAFAQFENTYALSILGVNSFDAVKRTRVGYTVGGGMEYAVTTNWSLRVEYRYTDWGRYTDVPPALNANIAPFQATFSHRNSDQRIQIGFSYRFADAVAPVVARY